MCRKILSWPLFLLVALLIQLWTVNREFRRDAEQHRSLPGYLYGDSGVYAAATDSLLKDGDLDLLNQCYPDRATLQEALPELEGEHGGEFGLSKQGYLTIKQSPVLSVAALPFRIAFGWHGYLIFNLVVLNLLLGGMARLAGGNPFAWLIVLIGFVTTPLWRYSYNFSPDLFLCLLLVGSVLAVRAQRPTLGGILAGIAVSSKIYVAALVLPVPLLILLSSQDHAWKNLIRFALGGVLGILPGLAFNAWLFGAPWVTGYERQLLVREGTIGLADHTSRFTVPIGTGCRNLLFHPVAGMWNLAPLWFLWPLAVGVLMMPRFAKPGNRIFAMILTGIILMNLAVFVTYDGWDGGSGYGNRYMFPAIVFGITLIATAVGTVANRHLLRSTNCTTPVTPARSP